MYGAKRETLCEAGETAKVNSATLHIDFESRVDRQRNAVAGDFVPDSIAADDGFQEPRGIAFASARRARLHLG